MRLIKKLFKENNFMSLYGNILISGMGFLSFILLSRRLSPDAFGHWVIFTSAVTLIDLVRFGLTRNALITFSAGVDKKTENEITASAFLMGLVIVLIITIIFIPAYLIAPDSVSETSLGLILKWYPLLALSNLGWNNGVSLLQSKMKFLTILIMRTLNTGMFVILLFIVPTKFIENFEFIILLFIASNLVASIMSFLGKYDGLIHLKAANKKRMLQIFNYGKYSVGSFLGSSLLRSADSFIIGLAPLLGPKGVAIYAIPMKLVEIMEIPLRSFSATAFPKLSAAFNKNNIQKLQSVFYTYSGVITSMFIPLVVFGILFAPQLVMLLGGKQYASEVETMANIFRIFCVYGLILPLDRMSGIMLDSLNSPDMNFRKILLMLGLNITGDLIAVYVFGSLEYVAAVTVVFTLIGAIAGWNMIRKKIGINFLSVITESSWFYKSMILKIKSI
ncbi:MAG: oligosaccharide flippase family protein [Bacteroidales bacterium]|nr:oligosaccharide flippase family protein [Bacteroidales bacterium]MCF8391514.1 oligosaccharide flippase family protein [Bacteroidales bacterium]